METYRTLQKTILTLFAVVVFALLVLIHFSIDKVVAEQSRLHQQSMSPAINLIVDELMQPLHVSDALGKSTELVDLMSRSPIDSQAIYNTLARLQNEFGMLFFIASDRSRIQYNSDGTSLALVQGNVSWYFKYRDISKDAVADVGKWEDPHFYIDIKIYDEQQNYLGFFGIGKSLESFLQLFAEYKKEYGYEFIFVDQQDNIMLSSDASLMGRFSKFTNLRDLSWYESLPAEKQLSGSLNNELIQIDNEDHLLAEVNLPQFDWRVYLITPLNERQTTISRGFIFSVTLLLMVVFGLFTFAVYLLKDFMLKSSDDIRLITSAPLPERQALEAQFSAVRQKFDSVSILLIEIDNFDDLVLQFGTQTAAEAVNRIGNYLRLATYHNEMLGMWHDHAFVIVLPESGPNEAFNKGKNIRLGITSLFPDADIPINDLTVSVGVSFNLTNHPIQDISLYAEDALYQAKKEGANRVRMALSQ